VRSHLPPSGGSFRNNLRVAISFQGMHSLIARPTMSQAAATWCGGRTTCSGAIRPRGTWVWRTASSAQGGATIRHAVTITVAVTRFLVSCALHWLLASAPACCIASVTQHMAIERQSAANKGSAYEARGQSLDGVWVESAGTGQCGRVAGVGAHGQPRRGIGDRRWRELSGNLTQPPPGTFRPPGRMPSGNAKHWHGAVLALQSRIPR